QPLSALEREILVADRELSVLMRRLFDLVDQGDGVVLERYAAVALFVGDQVRCAEAELPGALAGFKEARRAEVGPIDVGTLEDCQGLLMGRRDRKIRLGQISGSDQR